MLPRGFRRAFRLALRRTGTTASEIDEEIAFHLRERIDALVERGWSVEDATVEARRRFGDPAVERPALLHAARRRDDRLTVFEWLDALRTDLRISVRQLRRTPTFAFGAVAAFGLGIGANATMFSVVDRLLLRPPARVAQPQDIYTVHTAPLEQLSFPQFVNLRDYLAGSAAVAVQTRAWQLPIGRGDRARMAQTVFVDGSYFRVLGVAPAAGRLLGDDDARLPNGQPVAVIGFELWQRAYDGDPTVVGRELTISSTRVRIIGVAPQEFNGLDAHPVDVWMPLTLETQLLPPGPTWPWATAGNHWLRPFVRVAPKADPHQVEARALTLLRAAAVERSSRDTTDHVELRSILPSRANTFSPEAKIASLLAGVSILVLLIACSNVTNLMLARGVVRRREIGIRLALGVSRARLARALLVDALVLAAMGGVAAVAVAAAGAAFMRDVLLAGFVWNGSLIDGRTIAFIGCATLLAGAITGIVPAFALLTRFDLPSAIAGGRTPGSAHRSRAIASLVVTQTVLSAVLLIGALLFVRSLGNVRRVPLGLDMEHAVVVSLDATTLRTSTGRADALFNEMRAAVSEVPGVASVAVGEGMPFNLWYLSTRIAVPGYSPTSAAIKRGAFIRAVTSSYFRTIGTHVVQGDSFTERQDRADGEPIVIVSADMAKAFWPDGRAVGRCVKLAPVSADSMPCRRIIGVAEQTQESALTPEGLESALSAVVYVPLSQGRHEVGARTLVARVNASPADVISRIRGAIQRVEPNIPLPDIWLMQSRHDPELRPWRLGASMFGVFGLLALVLAALGLYSVVGYGVTQRTREMGIRIALGAQRRQIFVLVGAEGAVLVAIGIMIATIAAVLLAPLIQPLLFQTSARSVLVYALVGGALFVVAIAASLVPARRAARVSPTSVMRFE